MKALGQFIRPKDVIYDSSENFLLSQNIGIEVLTKKSYMPTPIKSYLFFKALIKLRIVQSSGL